MSRPFECHSQVVLKHRNIVSQLDRACQGREGIGKTLILDEYHAEVVHRPGIPVIDQDSLTVRLNGFFILSEKVQRAALETKCHVRLGIDLEDFFDLDQGLASSSRIEKYTAQVEHAFNMVGIELKRPFESLFRNFMITGFPGGETQHIETPGILSLAIRVRCEQPDGILISSFTVGDLRLFVGDLLRVFRFHCHDSCFLIHRVFRRGSYFHLGLRKLHPRCWNGFLRGPFGDLLAGFLVVAASSDSQDE